MDTTTRRGILGAIAGVPLAASFAAIPLPALATHSLFGELDAIDRETNRLSAIRGGSDAEWNRWEEWSTRVWRQIEALPATPANAKLKARCALSIMNGDLDLINDGSTDVMSNVVRQVLTGLAAH